MTKKVSAVAIQALEEALTKIYWYKRDLRSFLLRSLPGCHTIALLNWDDYKRNIVANLVDHLTKNEEAHQQNIVHLMAEVCQVTDFSHLSRLEDGEKKASEAKMAVEALKSQTKAHYDIQKEKRLAK